MATSSIDELVRSIKKLVGKPNSIDTSDGAVTRVDDDGTIWVRFNENKSDTPCVKSAVSAKAGDEVSVSVRKNRGVIVSNYTCPASDDSLARSTAKDMSAVSQAANDAYEAAKNALSDAQATHEAAVSAANDAASAAISAESAANDAASAAQSAEEAESSADLAEQAATSSIKSATDAYLAAIGALTSLGTVEDVMGTLDMLNRDKSFVKCPEGNVIVDGVTYYTKGDDGAYSVVENPVAEDIADYYVVDVNLMLANLVESHLTVTERGLYITPSKITVDDDGSVSFDDDTSNGYLLLGSDGMTVFDRLGNPIANYGGSMQLGDESVSATSITTDILRLVRHIMNGTVEEKELTAFEVGSQDFKNLGGMASYLRFGEFPDGSDNYLIKATLYDDPETVSIVTIGDKNGEFQTRLNLHGEVNMTDYVVINGKHVIWPLPIGMGGTGGETVKQAKANLKAYPPQHNDGNQRSSGYYKIKINSKANWMLSFNVYVYASYVGYGVNFSGYNYGATGTWHEPRSKLLYMSSSGTEKTVYFGHDGTNDLWVAIPANNYEGIRIDDVVRGHQRNEGDIEDCDLFTITYVTSLSGAIDSTQLLHSIPGMYMTGSHYQLAFPNGAASGAWLRMPSPGIIPPESKTAGNGAVSIGQGSWYFKDSFIDKMYGHMHPTSVGGTWVSTGTAPDNAAIRIENQMNSSSAFPIINVTTHDNQHLVMDTLTYSFYFGRTTAGQTVNQLNGVIELNTSTGTVKASDYSGKVNGNTFELSTENSADTWTPVLANSKIQHRVIPIRYNMFYWRETTVALYTATGSGSIRLYERGGIVRMQMSGCTIYNNGNQGIWGRAAIATIPAGWTGENVWNSNGLLIQSNTLYAEESIRTGAQRWLTLEWAITC